MTPLLSDSHQPFRRSQVVVPMPAAVQRVSCSYQTEPKPAGSQTWDWQERQRRLVWKFKKVPGGTEHTLQVPWFVIQEGINCRSLIQRQQRLVCEVQKDAQMQWRLVLRFTNIPSGAERTLRCRFRPAETVYTLQDASLQPWTAQAKAPPPWCLPRAFGTNSARSVTLDSAAVGNLLLD